MKKIITILCLAAVHAVHGQALGGIFGQNQTKIKYLLQQIATLQTYIGYVEKGYKIASSGLHTISDIKNGEFNLHEVFFSSLKTVNPKIKNAAEVAEIIALQISIVNHFKKAIQTYKSSSYFNNDEMSYIGNVYGALTADCLKDIDGLISVITDYTLQMTDDERIKQINKLYADMQDKKAFTQSFTNNAFLLAQQRQKEQNDISVTQQLYNVK
jgi:hypothetical protein